MQKKIYEVIIEKGKEFNLSNCGMHALDTMRMESGFFALGPWYFTWRKSIPSRFKILQLVIKKDIDFIGKHTLLKIKDQKSWSKICNVLLLKINKPGEPLLLHDEPIYLGDQIIGRTTSGNYSFNFKKIFTFGYIKNDHTNEEFTI